MARSESARRHNRRVLLLPRCATASGSHEGANNSSRVIIMAVSQQPGEVSTQKATRQHHAKNMHHIHKKACNNGAMCTKHGIVHIVCPPKHPEQSCRRAWRSSACTAHAPLSLYTTSSAPWRETADQIMHLMFISLIIALKSPCRGVSCLLWLRLVCGLGRITGCYGCST